MFAHKKGNVKNEFFTLPFFGGDRKTLWNGQTELKMPVYRYLQVTRRRTWVRREAKFVRSKKASIYRKIE